VFISLVQDASRFLAETFVTSSTPNCAQFEVVLLVVYACPWWSDVLWCLFGSICRFPKDSDARTNKGLGVIGRYAYSSFLFSFFHVVQFSHFGKG
jgi:hypothetical protein